MRSAIRARIEVYNKTGIYQAPMFWMTERKMKQQSGNDTTESLAKVPYLTERRKRKSNQERD